MVVHNWNPSYVGGIGKRTVVQGWPQTKTQNPIQKITKAKRTGSMAQVVECLPTKLRALSSTSSINK
jgi:hypothetical protein